MARKIFVLAAGMVLLAASLASAAVMDIAVLPAGDGMYDRYWGYFGSGGTFIADANPNSAYHYYWPGDGREGVAYMQFKLSDLTISSTDVSSATLNMDILGFTDGGQQARDTKGNIFHASNSSGATGLASQRLGGDQLVGTVTGSTALGWNSFDITDYFKNDLTNDYSWLALSISSPGYAGFSFSSAEGQSPAFLRITTSEVGGGPQEDEDGSTAVPEPMTMALFAMGGAGLAFVRKKQA